MDCQLIYAHVYSLAEIELPFVTCCIKSIAIETLPSPRGAKWFTIRSVKWPLVQSTSRDVVLSAPLFDGAMLLYRRLSYSNNR